MNLAMMLFPFHQDLADGTCSPRKLAGDLGQVGIAGLEPMLDWMTANARCWGELRRAAKDLAMKFPCLDVIVNLVGKSPADRRAAQDLVARGVDCCVELGCPCALLAGSNAAPGMSNEDGRKLYAEALAKAEERSKGSGVTLTIEDFGMFPKFACRAEHVLEVLDAAGPGIKFTFDNGNFLSADERPSECFRRLEPRMVHVHLKDFAVCPPVDKAPCQPSVGKMHKDCAIGAGQAEVDECLRLIKASRYAGWISLEVCVTPPLASVQRAALYVTKVWGGI